MSPSLPPVFESALRETRVAARQLRQASSTQKNSVLSRLRAKLQAARSEILSANREDLNALNDDVTPAFRDRLLLDDSRLQGITESLAQIEALPDPVGEVLRELTRPNGLKLSQVRAP